MTISSCNDPQGSFSRLTDMRVMRAVLQDHLSNDSGRRIEIDACQVRFARFRTYLKPQSRQKSILSVCYEVQIAARPGLPPEKQMFVGKAHLDGRSRAEYQAFVGAGDAPHAQDVWHLADLDLVLWRFPLDPRLPQLAMLADPRRVSDHLPFAAMGESASDIEQIDIQVIAYRPEVRCTTRLRVRFADARSRDIIAKSFADESGALVAERIRHLHETPAYRAAGLRVPHPLGYAAEIRTVWAESVNGIGLTDALAGSRANVLMSGLGKAVAALHAGQAPVSSPATREDLLLDARKKARKLGSYQSELHPALNRIVADCEAREKNLAPGKNRPIHGDLHLRQFLVAGEELVFLDFDEMQLGEIEQDLASLFVDLHRANPGSVVRLRESFREGYTRNAGKIDADKLAWYETLQWINKAYRTFWQQAPDHAERVREIVDLAAGLPRLDGPSAC